MGTVIKVIIECEAGSNQKNVFDEITLEDKESFTVFRTYPYILAVFKDENFEMTDEVKDALKEFVLYVWNHGVRKTMKVGNFYGKEEVEKLVQKDKI